MARFAEFEGGQVVPFDYPESSIRGQKIMISVSLIREVERRSDSSRAVDPPTWGDKSSNSSNRSPCGLLKAA